jgi:Lrp/AsnC family leucine-responsive transcriptional regulator
MMDHIDNQILTLLQKNARLSMTELGKKVGLTSPAATDRVRKLESQGVITGYRAVVSAERMNKHVVAYVLVAPVQCDKFVDFSRQHVDVVECHRIAGEYGYLTKVVTQSVGTLEQFIDEVSQLGKSTTLLVLSSPVDFKELLVDSVL